MNPTDATTDEGRSYHITAKRRAAHESTNEQLGALDGLLAALEIIESSLRFTDTTSAPAVAFYAINKLAREKMFEIWDRRTDEWVSLGGRGAPDSGTEVED